jgi:thiosulfate sulfurtransferase
MVVVCYHGHSSQQAAAWLAGQGFAEVYSLDGGFTEWEYRLPERVERAG